MKNVIKKYIDNLTIEDIENYIDKGNYNITLNEVKTIYKYIKNYWEEVYDGNTNIFNDLKKEVSPSTFIEIMRLYDKYKKWI